MDFDEYQALSAETDVLPEGIDGTRLALLGLVGEAGSAAAAAKKDYRDIGTPVLSDVLRDELGDMLWYAAAVARRSGLLLDEVAAENLRKSSDLFGKPVLPALSDEGLVAVEQLPRLIRVRFEAGRDEDGVDRSRMIAADDQLAAIVQERWIEWGRTPDVEGQIGDAIDDNASIDDHYRFHDAIHLAHAAKRGWSPVLRALLGRKRRSDQDTDRVEDGARAIATEEGLAAIVFRQLEQTNFDGSVGVPYELLSQVRWIVRGHEVATATPSAWRATYQECAVALRHLIDNAGGTLTADLEARELRIGE